MKPSSPFIAVLTAAVTFASSSGLFAATLQVLYGFDGTNATDRLAPTSVLENGIATSNVTASSISPTGYNTPIQTSNAAPGGVNQVSGAFFLSTTEGNPNAHLSAFFAATTADNNSEAEVAALNSQFFQLTLTPAAGYLLDLSTLTVDFAASGNTNGRNFFVRYDHSGSPNGFAGPSIVGGVITAVNSWSMAGSSGNLNGIPILNPGETITLRFYQYRTAEVTTAQNIRFDNITITGELTAIPEPTAAAMLGVLGTLGLLRRRPRK